VQLGLVRRTLALIVSLELTNLRESQDLSNRLLMQELLEEKWKLKATLEEVLQLGKQQNNIIHNLGTRIE
jgi:hypothetical protein